jgi:hypothetical protein
METIFSPESSENYSPVCSGLQLMVTVGNYVSGARSISRVRQYIGGNPYCHEGEGGAAVQTARGGGR